MEIYNSIGEVILSIDVDDNSYRYRKIMGDNSLTLYYSLAEHVELPVGAYCVFQSETYTLVRPENLTMRNTRAFEYTVTFESAQAKAKIWKFRNPVDLRLRFSYTANPSEHLKMFVDNMNRRDTGWTVGECISDTEKLINYDHDYCLGALSKIAQEFGTEYEIVGKCVSLHKVEYNKTNPLVLSYGKGKGLLPGIGRASSGDIPPIDVLFVQGGSTNIDRSKYGSGELHLPKNQTISYDGEYFEDEEGYHPENARQYLVDDLGLSIRNIGREPSTMAEDSLDRTEDYPKRVGVISEVVVVDEENHFYDFIDNSIPQSLDYSTCLIDGETMSVIFQSGELAGREFDVKYYHEAKVEKGEQKQARRFEIVPQEMDGIMMPGGSFIPRITDKYAVFGCQLPEAYIRDDEHKAGAEWDMFRSAVKYLFDNEEQKVSFSGSLDGLWTKKDWLVVGGKIKLGGFVKFTDERFQSDGILVRIIGIKDYINNPYSPEVELSNETTSAGFSATLNTIESQEVLVDDYHRDAIQFTKRRFRDAKETISMLEQSLLDNFSNSINPITVQTMEMLVGDESLQYRFVYNQYNPKPVQHYFYYDKTSKQLFTNSGTIQHMTMGINSISAIHKTQDYKFWVLGDVYVSPVLDDVTKKYYFYIRANRDDDRAIWYLSEEAKQMEAEEKYYYLLVGILNSEYNGERSFVTLYGFTEVLPGRIITDAVVSGDGESYFDMLSNAMKLGDSLDFNSLGDGKLRLRGTLVQSLSGDENYIGCYRGVWDAEYTYYNGDEVTYTHQNKTSSYRYVYNTPSKGNPPTLSLFWQVIAEGSKGEQGEKGEAGNFTELRYAKNGSTTTPPSIDKTALEPIGWSTNTPTVGIGEYLWVTSAMKVGDGSLLVTDWANPYRTTPTDGKDGKQGESPVMVFRGVYDSDKIYYGNNNRLDCVKFGAEYYIARIDAGTFSVPAPPDTSKWNPFGASFESIATNLLLADGANIGDWFISGGKIVSTLASGNKISLDARGKMIKVYSATSSAAYQGEPLYDVEVTLDANKGLVNAQGYTSNRALKSAYIAPTGIFANSAYTRCNGAHTSGYNRMASIVGLGNGNLDKYEYQLDEDERFVAGVYGTSSNAGTAPYYGGFFENLKICGLTFKLKVIRSSGVTLTDEDTFILGYGSYDWGYQFNVYLPIGTRIGQTIIFKHIGMGYMRVFPQGGECVYDGGVQYDYFQVYSYEMVVATFTHLSIDNQYVWIITNLAQL